MKHRVRAWRLSWSAAGATLLIVLLCLSVWFYALATRQPSGARAPAAQSRQAEAWQADCLRRLLRSLERDDAAILRKRPPGREADSYFARRATTVQAYNEAAARLRPDVLARYGLPGRID